MQISEGWFCLPSSPPHDGVSEWLSQASPHPGFSVLGLAVNWQTLDRRGQDHAPEGGLREGAPQHEEREEAAPGWWEHRLRGRTTRVFM